MFLFTLASLAFANGSDSHSTVFNEEIPGGGVVSEGMGFARRFGSPAIGSFQVAGIPPGARVRHAFLYWVMTGQQDNTVIVNGTEFTGDFIGETRDTCWGIGNNYAFRAEVDSIVSQNGQYEITGFDYVNGSVDNQGFSIVVIYEAPGSTDTTRIVINDGAIYAGSGYPVIPSQMSFDPIGAPLNSVKVHFMVGDSQSATDGPTTVNGTTIAVDNFEGDQPGGDGGMWDDDTFDLTGQGIINAGDTSLEAAISNPPGSDCLVWLSLIMQASYPNPCPDADLDGWTTCDDDCDDNDPAARPYAEEELDGIDNDCDGIIDEGFEGEMDNDGDGLSPNEGDCDDSNADRYPGADDIPGDGIDQDCDGADASEDDDTDTGDPLDDDAPKTGGGGCGGGSSLGDGAWLLPLPLILLFRRRRQR